MVSILSTATATAHMQYLLTQLGTAVKVHLITPLLPTHPQHPSVIIINQLIRKIDRMQYLFECTNLFLADNICTASGSSSLFSRIAAASKRPRSDLQSI